MNTDLGRGLGDEAVLDTCLVFLHTKIDKVCGQLQLYKHDIILYSTCEFFYGIFRGAQFSANLR